MEFTLTMYCYDRKFFLFRILNSSIEEVAKFIADDLTFKFNYCDTFFSRYIRCTCRLKKVVDDDENTIFEFSVKINRRNNDMASLLIDTLYEVAYEYIGELNVEVEIK